jgi:transposase InsO family protein
MITSFIDESRESCGAGSICSVLPITPSTYYEQKARQNDPVRLTKRVQLDAMLCEQIDRVWHGDRGIYVARKVWRQLRREGVAVARRTVERLMGQLGPQGIIRGRKLKTTIPDDAATQLADLVQCDFTAAPPLPSVHSQGGSSG